MDELNLTPAELDARWQIEKARRAKRLDDLIAQTNERFRKCVERGKHRRSNSVTYPRQVKGGYQPFAICRDCRVPVDSFDTPLKFPSRH